MAVIKSLISAISLYSKIPMPSLDYREGEDRFSLCFFPLVGLIIGGLLQVLCLVFRALDLSQTAGAIFAGLLPVIITGGMHLDGFMDCMDGVHCYGQPDKRLAILSDPHIGAFSVIKLLELAGLWLGCLILVPDSLYPVLGLGFVVSRALSGITLLWLQPAKESGMLHFTRSHASKGACTAILVCWLVGSFIAAIIYNLPAGLAACACSIFCLFYYRHRSLQDFGGITGDTAGCFLTMTETAWLAAVTIVGIIL